MLCGTRTLTLSSRNGNIRIPISISVPVQKGEGLWSCRYEVAWPDKKSAHEVSGADGIQALVCALQMIGAEIYTSNYHKAGDLYLDAPGQGYGFPVSAGIRDLLQGDDAKYL